VSANPWFKLSGSLRSILLPLLIPPLLLAAAAAQTQPPIFPTDSFTPQAGVLVGSLATGDFNGDGQPDVAYLSVPGEGTPPPTLTVLLNQGANNPPVAVTTNSLTGCTWASQLYSLVAADMNKDNKLDLVLTCPAGYVAVLIGNGDGSFQSPAYYAVSAPVALAPPVDLNGDGYPDVAVSTYLNNASGLAILLNQGSGAPGTLSTAKGYPGPAGVNPGSTAAGDFNGDGKQDIVVGGSSLAVYYGNGDGTLQTAQTTAGGPILVSADFNHDGLTDVAYIAGQTDIGLISFQVLLGASSGKFTTGANVPLDSWLGNPRLFIAGTTNGGSNVDVAVVGNYTSILLGDGKGGFTYGNSYALSGFPSATETGANGQTNLVFSASPGFSVLEGNGDGTFQGTLRILLGQGNLTATNGNGQFATADLNGDGLTDVVGIGASLNLVSALGRGDGTFSSTNTTAGSPIENVATGDFNGDGKLDVVASSGGAQGDGIILSGPQDSALYFYAGNGNGTFQASLSGIDLKTAGAEVPVVGDFNSDNNLDVVLPYCLDFPESGSGLIFVPGKGNGNFGSPVLFSQQNTSTCQQVLVADLNNDKKLDLVWNGAVYLGNGDGTFQQTPLGLTGTPLALADLNGDGIPDLFMGSIGAGAGTIYAGNGNGTFQPTPFYTLPLSDLSLAKGSASVGDVNADGHPDIVLQYTTGASIDQVIVLFGDGTGNFTLDSNNYYSSFFNDGSLGGALVRLNNQAPKLANDNALDYLSFSTGAVIPLLNQTNPKPIAATLASSSTVLAVSANTASENRALTFTATVTGFAPTGTVSFTSGATTLGTVAVTNGTATLSASFGAAGTYSVTASYAGDVENQPSTSNAVSITVAAPIAVEAPDFTVAVSPATATVIAGQPVAATLTITPVAGYSGTVSFSCGTLPSLAACTFAPSSVTPSNGAAATTKLTITTTAPSASTQRGAIRPLEPMAWFSVTFLLFLPGRRAKRYRHRMYSVLMVLFLMGGLISLSGCGGANASASGGAPSTTTSTPGTPTGTQTITVSATDSTGKLAHSVTLQIVVQ
jgi:Bacterial Ig-like domain (group 3)/FG-GAP-like repeat